MSDLTNWEKNNQAHLAELLKWLQLKLRELIPEQPSIQIQADDNKGSGRGWFRRGKSASENEQEQRLRLSAPEVDELDLIKERINDLEQESPPPALLMLAQNLGLSKFEQQVLALCVAQELDTQIPGYCALAQDDISKDHASFALAFGLFDEPDWAALSPQGPLRYWRLIEINQPGATPLTTAALKADERILNYIKGLNYLDDRITPMVHPLNDARPGQSLPLSQQKTADHIADYLRVPMGSYQTRSVQLQGKDSESKRLVAARVCAMLGLNAYVLPVGQLPESSGDLELFIRLWQRESLLMPLALYIDATDINPTERQSLTRFVQRFFQGNNCLVFMDEDLDNETGVAQAMAFEILKPTPEEQSRLWSEALGAGVQQQLPQITEQFSFNQSEIQRIASWSHNDHENQAQDQERVLWQICRVATRSGMEKLARRIDTKATWKDIVLPEQQANLLTQIAQQIFNRKRVFSDWGFREKMNRGMGISALFCGESGVGKTMAAEVIANACQLDLYSIDLSAVTSKYIGETEKNLRKLFDAAEDSGAILFFDEADALFGKRSEVKDSHDRYANTQIDYLLQRMEQFNGLSILATNMKSALDKAFTRRLSFIVDFPNPDTSLRHEIWHKVFPEQTPLSPNIDYKRLAGFNLNGGNIHNIAVNAAFLAAEVKSEVTMRLILDATLAEFRKLEKPTKDTAFQWQEPLEAVK
jgi:AAA+ superfamily predicted ATPase